MAIAVDGVLLTGFVDEDILYFAPADSRTISLPDPPPTITIDIDKEVIKRMAEKMTKDSMK
jgi:hypothetical protein